MFNLFFRRYVPGFRVGPDGAPRFNVNDSSLPPSGTCFTSFFEAKSANPTASVFCSAYTRLLPSGVTARRHGHLPVWMVPVTLNLSTSTIEIVFASELVTYIVF